MNFLHTFVMLFMIILMITVIKAEYYEDDEEINENDTVEDLNKDSTPDSDENKSSKSKLIRTNSYNDSSKNSRNTSNTQNNSRSHINNKNNGSSNYNQNIRNTRNIHRKPDINNNNPADRTIDDVRDDQTGLSYRTVRIISTLPPCQNKLLINYRRLLRSPDIRLQFFRDLYQLKQKNYLEGCEGDDAMIEIGSRERRILMKDKYFRRQVEFLMSKRAVGAAIRGPTHYPNDIDNLNSSRGTRILTITKQ